MQPFVYRCTDIIMEGKIADVCATQHRPRVQRSDRFSLVCRYVSNWHSPRFSTSSLSSPCHNGDRKSKLKSIWQHQNNTVKENRYEIKKKKKKIWILSWKTSKYIWHLFQCQYNFFPHVLLTNFFFSPGMYFEGKVCNIWSILRHLAVGF